MKPGDLGYMDSAFTKKHAYKIKRLIHCWFRAKIFGMENIPDSPFIAIGNHSGGTLIPDTIVWLSHYYTCSLNLPLLTLSSPGIFSFYPNRLAQTMARMGAVRADSRLAIKAIEQGNALQIYPGGDFDACRTFSKRNQIIFAGHTAYAKLAKKTSLPIIPIVSIGGHEALWVLNNGARLARALQLDKKVGLKTFPLSICFPWGLWLGPLPGYLPIPTQISIKVLPPIIPEGDINEIDLHVRTSMQSCLNDMAKSRRYLGI